MVLHGFYFLCIIGILRDQLVVFLRPVGRAAVHIGLHEVDVFVHERLIPVQEFLDLRPDRVVGERLLAPFGDHVRRRLRCGCRGRRWGGCRFRGRLRRGRCGRLRPCHVGVQQAEGDVGEDHFHRPPVLQDHVRRAAAGAEDDHLGLLRARRHGSQLDIGGLGGILRVGGVYAGRQVLSDRIQPRPEGQLILAGVLLSASAEGKHQTQRKHKARHLFHVATSDFEVC